MGYLGYIDPNTGLFDPILGYWDPNTGLLGPCTRFPGAPVPVHPVPDTHHPAPSTPLPTHPVRVMHAGSAVLQPGPVREASFGLNPLWGY